MSLLLDALKKAAEQKAKKSGEASHVEPSETEETLAVTQHDVTDLTDSVTFGREKTELDQEAELTESTQEETLTVTQQDVTDLTDSVTFDHESTELRQEAELTESTQIDATSIDDTRLTEATFSEAVEDNHEPTELDQETEFTEATQIDATSIDDTAFTEITALEQQPSHDSSGTEVDLDSDDETKINDDEVDAALIDKIVHDRDDTQVDQTDLSSLDRTEKKLDTEIEYQPLAESEGLTETAFTDSDVIYQYHKLEMQDDLTQDDVTQFMGDGVSEHSSPKPSSSERQQGEESEDSDDTAPTNPESLTITNFSFSEQKDEEPGVDEDIPQGYTESDALSFEDQASAESLSQEDISGDDELVHLNADSTSTASSIDIEMLTNDQTVTVGDKTSTKTFAPDNYDRTLLNLSQKDVSKIFPGMQPESDQVMTPDYAKRVFLSKSSQFKTHYYKLYAATGLMLLLSVIMWGLFQLQEESELIDQRLVNLKRDPMPGLIKPRNENESDKLFLPESKEAKIQAVAIISKVDELEADLSTPLKSEKQALSGKGPQGSLTVQNETTTEIDDLASVSIEVSSEGQASKSVKPVAENESAQSKSSSNSTLSISRSSQVSQKSQLLVEAYKAYEQSDIATARELYTKVLAIDETDRDGLLGRAAIHILDNEYQQAIEKYQQLLIDNPKDSMAMASMISVANIDPQLGETQLKRMLREQPESPYLHFVLGNMYGSQNRWHDAQNSYFEALQKKPADPNYAYNLAVSLEHIGKSKLALTFYEKALANSSTGLVTFDQQLVTQRLEALAQ